MPRLTLRLLCLTAGLLVLAVGPVPPADAGDGPYGPTTTTEPPAGADPTCSLNKGSGVPGDRVTASVTNVPVGQVVRIFFDGEEVARSEAGAEVVANGRSTVVLLGGTVVAAGVETTTVTIDFNVPDVDPGRYAVAAVGDTFTSACGSGEGGEFAVLASRVGGGSGGDDSLPKTGIYVALLVAVALALVLGGRALLGASRRRPRGEREPAAGTTGSRTVG
jgi:hypothetical protein